jgi:hypothetical protein
MDYVESEMCADLLIYSATHLETIHTETFTEIVSTLYYKYYLAWQDNAPASRQERYKRYIDGLYSKLEANLRGKKTISVNGHQHVLATPTESQTVSHRGIVTFSIMALVVIVLLAAALLGLKAYFGLSDSSFITMYGLAIISFFAVTGVVSKEARAIFGQLLTFAKYASRKRVGSSKPNPSKAGRISPPSRDDQ